MKRAFCVLLTLFLTACSTSQARGSHDIERQPGGAAAPAESLEQMLARDDFDLPRALLLFSREHQGEMFGPQAELPDMDAWLARFDRYAFELKRDLRRANSPRSRMLTLIEFVHERLGLRFDSNDPNGHNPENLFFDRVLTRKRGYCVTLSLAYIVFGQAAGLNVAGVRIPGHFAVMFVDGQGPDKVLALIESTANGAQLDELEVWSKHRFSVQSVENGCYLTPLGDKQIFGVLYNNLAGLAHLQGNSNLALRRYSFSLELMPNNPEALYNRALVQRGLEMPQPALRDLNEAIRFDPNFTLAYVARAGLLFEAGEMESGKRDLNVALRQRPEWPQPHMLEATLAAREGRLEDAQAALERALARDPANKDAHAAMAQVLRRLGKEEAARRHEALARWDSMNVSTTQDALHASALKALEQALPMARREELATAHLAQFREGACRAGVLLQSAAHGTQLGALRFMFADGRTPFALMPSAAAEFFELFAFADSVARLWNIPAVLAVEPELLADMASAKSPSSPPTVAGAQRAAPLPLPLEERSEAMRWQNLVRANAEKLALTRLDRQPAGEAKVDWLVVSYGVTAQAAQAAVSQAREKGLGVDHLVLQTLSPLPERAIASAAMGKRFVVVPERNLGQLHPDIQRLCPSLPCVLVSDGLSPIQPGHVLNALMRFPRCC